MKVGCVPYINALPLIWPAVRGDADWPVEVVYDVPSALPSLLEEGEVDAILVSSIEVLRKPGLRAADGLGICSRGPVESVRLISSMPLDSIRSFTPDPSSMTSNALARTLLARLTGFEPGNGDDARVLIGDQGLQVSEQSFDLGELWTEHTGLPFVWALWVGRDGLSPELSGLLTEALRRGLEDLESVKKEALRRGAFSPETVHRYFDEVMRYSVGPDEKAALRLLGEWVGAANSPDWVAAKVGVAP